MMKSRLPLICSIQWILLTLCFGVADVALAGQHDPLDNPCIKTPTHDCLIAFIDKALKSQDNTTKQSKKLLQLWTLERKKNALITSDENHSTEEKNVRATQQPTLQDRQVNSASFFQPLRDASGRSPASLRIEYLTLNLKDNEADQLKRQLIDHELVHNPKRVANTIIDIASAEIIGGSPQKGKNTLSKAKINEFSNTLLVFKRQSLLLMADLSSQLFLDPTYNETRCQGTENPTLQSLNAFFSTETIALLSLIQQIPDTLVRMGQELGLILLHKNADSCPLLSTVLLQYFIQQEIDFSLKNDSPLSHLIYFSIAIRRHVER